MSEDITAVKTKNRNTILAAGMVIQLCAGIIYMWSVFKSPVSAHLSWDQGSAALVTSIMMVAFVTGMVTGGKLVDTFGVRKIALIGSAVMSCGIFATAFVTSSMPAMLYVTYAIIGGLGVGMVYSCTVSNVQKWFFDRRGFATGMMVGAFGFSMVVFAPVATYLLGSVGVPSTFMILGLLFLTVCTISSLALCNPPEDYTVTKGGVKVNVAKSQKQYGAKEMMKTRTFFLIYLSLFFVISAFFMLNPMLMTLGIERGLTREIAMAGVMIVGLFNAAGRLSITWLSDRIGRTGSMLMIAAITAIGITAMIFAQSYAFLACLAAIAFAFGGASGVYAAVTADSFGTKNMGVNYGIVTTALGASSLVFTTINTRLSGSGDYTMSFVLAAVTCILSMILILLLRRERSTQETA